MAELGLKDALCPDYLYAINILAAEGILPQVDFIRSERNDTFDTPEQAAESLRRMIDGAAGAVVGEQQRKPPTCACTPGSTITSCPTSTPDRQTATAACKRRCVCATPGVITWAFIAWDK